MFRIRLHPMYTAPGAGSGGTGTGSGAGTGTGTGGGTAGTGTGTGSGGTSTGTTPTPGAGAGSPGGTTPGTTGTGTNPGAGSAGTGGTTETGDGSQDHSALAGLAPAQLVAMIADLRNENATRRVREREIQTQLEQFQNRDLTDAQRLQRDRERLDAERAQLTLERQNANIAAAFSTAGNNAQAVYPEILWMLVPRDQITLDKSDQPTNVTALLNALKAKYPILFKTTTVNGGAGNGSRTPIPDNVIGADRIRAAYANGVTGRERRTG